MQQFQLFNQHMLSLTISLRRKIYDSEIYQRVQFLCVLSQAYPGICVQLAQCSVTTSSQFTTLNILIQKHNLALLESSLLSKTDEIKFITWKYGLISVFPKDLGDNYRKAPFY